MKILTSLLFTYVAVYVSRLAVAADVSKDQSPIESEVIPTPSTNNKQLKRSLHEHEETEHAYGSGIPALALDSGIPQPPIGHTVVHAPLQFGQNGDHEPEVVEPDVEHLPLPLGPSIAPEPLPLGPPITHEIHHVVDEIGDLHPAPVPVPAPLVPFGGHIPVPVGPLHPGAPGLYTEVTGIDEGFSGSSRGLPGTYAPAFAGSYGPSVGPEQLISQSVEVTQTQPVPIPVSVVRHVPVPVPVVKNVPFIVPHPIPVPIRRPYVISVPHPVPKRVPVTIVKKVPYTVERLVPYSVPQPYPIKIIKKIPVLKPVPVRVPVYKYKTIHHYR